MLMRLVGGRSIGGGSSAWVAAVQAPEDILTVLRALKLPSGPHGSAVFNALLDHGHVEKLALVEVPPTPLRSHAAPGAHGMRPGSCPWWAAKRCSRQGRRPCMILGSSIFSRSELTFGCLASPPQAGNMELTWAPSCALSMQLPRLMLSGCDAAHPRVPKSLSRIGQDECKGLALVRGPLMRERVITDAWARNGWHGYRKGGSETSVPGNPRSLQQRLNRRARPKTLSPKILTPSEPAGQGPSPERLRI